MKNLILVLATLLIVSCGKSSSVNFLVQSEDSLESQPVGVEISIGPSSSGIEWNYSHTELLLESFYRPEFKSMLEIKLNQSDLDRIQCPGYNNFAPFFKQEVLTGFLAAIAEAESDYEVDQLTYNKSDRTMNVGMLQIDTASAKRHAGNYFGGPLSQDDLKDPEKNLLVGLFILKHQLETTKGRLFPGATYYWQVLSGKAARVERNASANLKWVCGEM